MKRIAWLVVIACIAAPGWAAKRMTVQQLKDTLAAAQKAQKSDAEVAAQLKDVELTEALTHSTMDGLKPLVPGQLTTEQIFVLEVRSAVLPPPASEIPPTPPPDAAKQKAILDKAGDFAKAYSQMPALTATRTLRRFQDSAQQDAPSFGAQTAAVVSATYSPIRYTASDDATVTFRNGVEQNPLANVKNNWGENGMVVLLGQSPDPASVLQAAQAGGKISWLRWETVNGHDLAVFSYSVDKKKSQYTVNYCCFPADNSQVGEVAMRGVATGGGTGNYQNNSQWKPFKGTEGYHGELYVDPDTGVIYRLITEVEFKGSDPVKVENQRIDFGTETVGGKKLVVPAFVTIDTLEKPFPDSPQGRFIVRHTLFTAAYSNYKPAGS